MNRTLVWFAVLLACTGVAIWQLSGTRLKGLSVTAPAGGETWEAGTSHAIMWHSAAVPAGDKISITIRRIPPPPLPQDGQEFDPILFTDLPNTGSTTWTISPMYPGGTYILGIHAYRSVPVTDEVSAESAPFSIIHPKMAIDLYPFYDKVSWQRSVAESVTIGTTTWQGAGITSYPVEGAMNPGSLFTPFLSYYDKLLKERGWKIENSVAAGGHVGGQTGYVNGNGLILVRFHILYHSVAPDRPSECPCDVTLSLFSNVTN